MKVPLLKRIKTMMIHTLNVFCGTDTKELLMKVSEISVAIEALSVQLAKVQGEILGKIADLENALIDVELPESAAVALDGLRVGVQALDDIVPDVPPPPVEPDPADPVVPVE